MSQFNYITNYVSGSQAAKMRIFGPIGDVQRGVNGDDFARELEYLTSHGVAEIVIDINSPGGSIKEGFSIFQAIKDCQAYTITRVVGIAASMAGIISQAADKRIIMDYGIFHTHGPQVPEGKSVDAKLLEIMKGSLTILLSNKTSLSTDKINELLSSENVFTALQAREMGFFDEIELTKGERPELTPINNVEALYTMANEFILNTNKMDKLNAILGLENATEEQMLEAVNALKANAEALEAKTTEVETLTNELTAKSSEIETLSNELTTVKEKAEALEADRASSLIENAISSGKLTKEGKDLWTVKAKADFEGTKELLSSINSIEAAKELTNELEQEAEEAENRKNWDFQKWGQEDPKGLDNMRVTDSERFNNLLNEYLESKNK